MADTKSTAPTIEDRLDTLEQKVAQQDALITALCESAAAQGHPVSVPSG